MLFSIVLIITNTSCILVKSLVETDFPYNEKGGNPINKTLKSNLFWECILSDFKVWCLLN